MPELRATLAFLVLACPVLACLALIGCTQSSAPQITSGYRTGAAPIYSTAALPIARMLGTWRQVAGFGASAPCTTAPTLQIAAQGGSATARYDLCFGPNRRMGAGQLASGGAQGRYRLPSLDAPLWVLWIDEGNRSAALGTPDGAFGMIVSKDPISKDRMRAATEVLAWNGYDLTQFHQY